MQEDFYESVSKPLRNKLIFEMAKDYAFDYMDGISERHVYPKEEDLLKLKNFYEPLPQVGTDEEEILLTLHKNGSPNTLAQTGGRYYGFVNGGALPVTLAVKWLTDVWDQNSVLYVASPIAGVIEEVCERWIVDLFGLPTETAMGLVGGSSDASLCALTVARNTILERNGYNIYENGLMGAPEIRVVLSENAHATLFKALSILGIGSKNIIKVESNPDGTLRLDKLPELDEKTILILQAGNVNTGAFDQFDTLCDLANEKNAWIHIDGAFGLWAKTSKEYAYLAKGMEKATSWSVDAHKTLNVPYDCGIVLCKYRDAFCKALQANGDYIIYSGKRDGMLYTTAMSRRARSFELWATIKYLGKEGIGTLVEALCKNAKTFAERLAQLGFTILNDVVYNQVLIQYVDDEMTKCVLEYVQEDRVCWCGPTQWKGNMAIRLSVCSWATTKEDLELCIDSFKRGIEYTREKGK